MNNDTSPSIFNNIDETLNKFNYCSMGNSKLMEIQNIKGRITPERQYRECLINWQAVAGALKEYHFKNEQNDIKIKRQHIRIRQIDDKISKAQDSYERELLELDKESICLKLQELESTKKLTMPLVKDAWERLHLLEQTMKVLEEGGLRPFEEAELEYQRRKALQDLRAERIANQLGVSKGSIEWAHTYGADISEFLNPNSLEACIKNPEFSLEMPLNDRHLALVRNEEFVAKKNLLIAVPKKDNNEILGTNIDPMVFIYPHGIAWDKKFLYGYTYDEARNRLVEYAKEIGVEYIFFLDDDILMPQFGLLELYNSMVINDLDIVGGYYYQKLPNRMPTWGHSLPDKRHTVPEVEGQNKPVECNWVIPTGCMLIRMSVFDKIEKPYFNMIYDGGSKMTVGEDCYFITKCNSVGIKTYINPKVKCGHIDYANNRIYWGDQITPFVSGEQIVLDKGEDK